MRRLSIVVRLAADMTGLHGRECLRCRKMLNSTMEDFGRFNPVENARRGYRKTDDICDEAYEEQNAGA